MKTVSILIGNSDDKLTQKGWAGFVADVQVMIDFWASEIHFFGSSSGHLQWQNACWVIEIEDERYAHLKDKISDIGKHYKQFGVAWIEGVTEMI